MLFAGTAHYPLRSSAPSNAQALTASRPDATFQFFPNRNRAAMRWSVMLGSLLDAFPLSAETDSVTRAFDRCLNFDPFDFLERKFLAGAIVEFWRGDSWFPMVWASPRVQSYRRKDFHAGNNAKRQVWLFWDGKIT
jgi:hypothetical protein